MQFQQNHLPTNSLSTFIESTMADDTQPKKHATSDTSDKKASAAPKKDSAAPKKDSIAPNKNSVAPNKDPVAPKKDPAGGKQIEESKIDNKFSVFPHPVRALPSTEQN